MTRNIAIKPAKGSAAVASEHSASEHTLRTMQLVPGVAISTQKSAENVKKGNGIL